MAPQPTMAIFIALPLFVAELLRQREAGEPYRSGGRRHGCCPPAASSPGRGLRFLPTAILGREHQAAQKRLFVDPQQVRMVALHVGADEILVRGNAHEMTERLGIPSPWQLEFAERAVVRLEFRGEGVVRRSDRYGLANYVWHR